MKKDGIRVLTGTRGIAARSPPFTHIAYDDFRIVRANLLQMERRTTEGRISAYTIFTDPELARVGLTEREAQKRGDRIQVAKLPMSRVVRAMETDETRGFVNAVVDEDSNRVLGAAVLGIRGGKVVAVIQAAMIGGLPYTALRDAPFAHPTLAESLNNLFATLES